jgi:hypothetical protein
MSDVEDEASPKDYARHMALAVVRRAPLAKIYEAEAHQPSLFSLLDADP